MGSESNAGHCFQEQTIMLGKVQSCDSNALSLLFSFPFKITKQAPCSSSDGAGDLDWLFCTSFSCGIGTRVGSAQRLRVKHSAELCSSVERGVFHYKQN